MKYLKICALFLTMVISPSGPTCRHVLFQENGETVETSTIEEIMSPLNEKDSFLLAQVKTIVREMGSRNINEVKEEVESRTVVTKR